MLAIASIAFCIAELVRSSSAVFRAAARSSSPLKGRADFPLDRAQVVFPPVEFGCLFRTTSKLWPFYLIPQ